MSARFVVYGAGAIGGVVGARVAQSGHEVVLIARGRHREAIARDGVTAEELERVQNGRLAGFFYAVGEWYRGFRQVSDGEAQYLRTMPMCGMWRAWFPPTPG